VPLVVAYTTFVFITFKGKVKLDEMSYWSIFTDQISDENISPFNFARY
jgi:hypothetical protein